MWMDGLVNIQKNGGIALFNLDDAGYTGMT